MTRVTNGPRDCPPMCGLDSGGPAVVEPAQAELFRPVTLRRRLSADLPLTDSVEDLYINRRL
jgi:hypothetical protein